MKNILRLFLVFSFLACFPQPSMALYWVKLLFHNKSGTQLTVGKFDLKKTFLLKTNKKENEILKENDILECNFLHLAATPGCGPNISIKFYLKQGEVEFIEYYDRLSTPVLREKITVFPSQNKKYEKLRTTVSATVNTKKCEELKLVGLIGFKTLPNIFGIHRTIIEGYACSEDKLKKRTTENEEGDFLKRSTRLSQNGEERE